MANKYKLLASTPIIYINHSMWAEEADTIRMVYSMVANQALSNMLHNEQILPYPLMIPTILIISYMLLIMDMPGFEFKTNI